MRTTPSSGIGGRSRRIPTLSAGARRRTAQGARVTLHLCVFCGARTGTDPFYAGVARDAARAIVRAGYGIVYGGGRIGLMGVLADAALEAGGEVIGVIPDSLSDAEIAHAGITRLDVVASMHERKALMAQRSNAFLALPGGYGTMDEFCEILTWRQLGLHDKPIGLLNAGGFYDPLIALFDRMVDESFVTRASRALFVAAATIDELLAKMLLPLSS
jgi:uncharacterized protein (TIGR00730 family)